jgi:hypothetical protein
LVISSRTVQSDLLLAGTGIAAGLIIGNDDGLATLINTCLPRDIIQQESQMSETLNKFERDTSFDDLDSVVSNIESIPSMAPKLERIGVSKPPKDRNSSLAVVEIGFRHFHKGQLNFREYELYE